MPTPTKISWDDALSTGDEQLDEQHKILLSIFNDLATSIENGAQKDDIARTLTALKNYANWHFACEEDCMDKYQCPASKINKKAHAIFLQKTEEYEGEFQNAENFMEFALQVHDDLTRWIYTHILEVDASLYHSIHSTRLPKDF